MRTYWAFVRIEIGSFMRVTVQATNPYDANQMLKSMYGDKVSSYPAPC